MTTISEASKARLVRWVGRGFDIRVIHCPLGGIFRPQPKEFQAHRPRVLQVGTAHNKNIGRLAEALRGMQAELRIIGRLSEGQKLALTRSGVTYTFAHGLTDEEMTAEYVNADLVTLVSTYEGFGLPIIEAQAVGRAVITSDLLSMPEVAGAGACLVDPYDVQSIRRGILRVATDRSYRDTLIAEGFRNVKRFDANSIAQRYGAIYHEVASQVGSC